MKKVWNWILRNLSNIFGFLGIVVTIYIGAYYVPKWLKDVQNEKTSNAQENLVQSIKELIYADSLCFLKDITVLIEAKEVDLKETFPLSTKQLLLSVQESFMQDKYLPLEKRRKLIREVENLKSQIEPQNEILDEPKNKNIAFLGWLSIVISLILALIGSISFYVKYKNEKAKQEEIDIQIEQVDDSLNTQDYLDEFKQKIINVLHNIPDIKILENPLNSISYGFDIVFLYEEIKYCVEIKYLKKSKVGLGSLQKFLALLRGQEGNYWFIYNTDLTEMVKKKVEALNKVSLNRKIELIKVITPEDFELHLKYFLKKS